MALILNGTTGVSAVQDGVVNPLTDIAGGIPCFSAYANTSTSLVAATLVKMNINAESFDTTNAYDATNSRFTPQKAGYYHIIGSIRADYTNMSTLRANIVKNGQGIVGAILLKLLVIKKALQ